MGQLVEPCGAGRGPAMGLAALISNTSSFRIPTSVALNGAANVKTRWQKSRADDRSHTPRIGCFDSWIKRQKKFLEGGGIRTPLGTPALWIGARVWPQIPLDVELFGCGIL